LLCACAKAEESGSIVALTTPAALIIALREISTMMTALLAVDAPEFGEAES
jgi:hypothetical protein